MHELEAVVNCFDVSIRVTLQEFLTSVARSYKEKQQEFTAPLEGGSKIFIYI